MALTYVQHWNELLVWVPKLSPELAKRLVNRALDSIYGARPWSFLTARTQIRVPAEITTGACAVTLDSQTVTPSAAAVTALTGLTNPVITHRQIRFGGGPVYNIQAWDGATLTLDRAYTGSTNAAASYSVYQAYFHVPSDFSHWVSVVDRDNQFSLQLGVGARQVDLADPQRSDSGDPYILAEYRAVPSGYWDATVTAGRPMFELWPHRKAARVYEALYQRQGTLFTADTDTAPDLLDDDLIASRARMLAYEWAFATGNAPSSAALAYQAARAEFAEALRDARRLDNEWAERNIVTWLRPGHYIGGAAWRQSHDLPAL